MPDGGLPCGDPEEIARVACALTLQDRLTSARKLWKPNDEQRALWALVTTHRYVLVAKPRKTGISTAAVLDDLLWTNAADAAGNGVRTVFAIDTDDKASEHLLRAFDFAVQLGLSVRKNESSGSYRLTFPHGSRLDFVSLGGDNPGRGGDIHRLHITELPYAAHPENAYHSLRSACADNAIVIVETTMTSTDPFTVALWRGFRRDAETGRQIHVGTEFVRKFFSVEDHQSYRLDAQDLTDEQWRFARDRHGFTIREAAAWWLLHALPNLAGGNLLTLMHDYPQMEDHLFVAEAGRVVTVTPEIAEVVDRLELHGMSGQVWQLEVYIRPEDSSGMTYIPVDTAWGRNKTRSVVLVVDRADARILASFASAIVMPDDLARMAQLARHHYLESVRTDERRRQRCDLIVENNGSGLSTIYELSKLGCPATEMDQVRNYATHGEDACIRAAKRQIEGGGVAGPPELAEECDALKKERGVFVGLKDVLMTYGMALVRRREEGIRTDEWKKTRKDPMRVYTEDRMREERRAARWGRR